LNSIQHRIQQLACIDSGASATDTGGWCNRVVAAEHRTDAGLAKALAMFFYGSRVAGLGDGLGHYQRLVTDDGFVARYDAYDGSPFVEELTNGRVRFLDLAVPQFWLPVYDWTLCLEVLEHIPEQYESIAVDNVVRPARVGVVLSWARPGQGGLEHVNTRPQEYVGELMKRRGFRLDVASSNRLRDESTFAWLKFTLNVYRRTDESIEHFDSMRRRDDEFDTHSGAVFDGDKSSAQSAASRSPPALT
jgi:hypothetical protein